MKAEDVERYRRTFSCAISHTKAGAAADMERSHVPEWDRHYDSGQEMTLPGSGFLPTDAGLWGQEELQRWMDIARATEEENRAALPSGS